MSTKELTKTAAAHNKKNPYSLGAALSHGGPVVWLSCLIMGLDNMAAGQIIKGLMYLAVEVAVIAFLVTRGGGIYWLSMLPGLGELEQQKVWNEAESIYEYTPGDQSQLILLYGVATVLILCVLAFVWFWSVRSGYKSLCLKKAGKKVPTFAQDVKALFDASAAADQAAASAATAAEAAARKALVGTWLQRDSDWEDTYIFNADGSGMLISGPEYPFTYAVNGDILTLTYGPDDEEEFTISVDGDLMTMIDMWDEELLLDKKTEEVPASEIDQTETTEAAVPTLEELIIGTWEDQESDYKETFTFNKDGTGKYSYEDGGHWEYTFTYSWYNGDYVEFIYDDDGYVSGFTVRIEDDVMYATNTTVVDMPLVRK